MPRIVISYRRADSAPTAGRIADNLEKRFGRKSVFMDTDSIPLGRDFRKHLKETLDHCDVMLVIIGPNWLQELKNESDSVRLEIETAIARKGHAYPCVAR